MKRLPRIAKITSVEKPYKIYTVWTNGDERLIDLSGEFAQWVKEGEERFTPLKKWDVFSQVSVSAEHTLCWENLQQTIKLPSGKTIGGALDLDPDVLFEKSELIRQMDPMPNVGAMLRKARLEAGLSQTEVAINSGTTRAYISRVENGRTDIQVRTLYRIMVLGVGKELNLEFA